MSTRRPNSRLSSALQVVVFLLFGLSFSWANAARTADDAADALPSNLNRGLRQLIVWHRAQPRVLSRAERRTRLAHDLPARASRVQVNAAANVAVVRVLLDGQVPLPEVQSNLRTLGLEILAVSNPGQTGAILSARLPLDQAERAAVLPGVRSVALAHRPWRHVGKVTTGGVYSLGLSGLGASTNGTGITVGVLSDSYDLATQDAHGDPLKVRAANDVASGDLPGPGNPLGHTQPVYVLAEGDPEYTEYYQDEGRAMLQIVHDLAPGASLAFATTGLTPETFAQNVRALRTNPDAHCDVIVDDITFPDEPMFSDGPAAQAVYDVTHDATIPGHKVLYYAAAGNNGDYGYAADFNPVRDLEARADDFKGNLKLDQVPGNLTYAGFHNFDTRPGKVSIAQRVTIKDHEAEIDFQWDDPFGVYGVTASDYNLLVFDADGNYLKSLSGIDRNPELGNALELVDLPAGDGGATAVYQLAITRTSALPGKLAKRLRYVVNTYGDFTAKFTGHNAPTIFGHAVAVGADAVAAYDTYYTALERYTSLGPATILFDRDGNRQPPEIRQQPTLAAVDGVNTTFFGADTDRDEFPNFYGTSAAAPHAAGCAALLLQAAGGPGSLSNQQARTLLQGSAAKHDTDPNARILTAATKVADPVTVTLSEVRDDVDPAGAKKFFRLSFTGPDTERLRKIVITLLPSTMTFDDMPGSGKPFAVGAVSGHLRKSDVTASLGSNHATGTTAAQERNQLTVNFAPDAFGPDSSVSFGVGINKLRDFRGLDPLQWAMIGTNFTARLTGPSGKSKVASSLTDADTNTADYSPFVGSGLIDFSKTLGALQENGPPTTPDSRVALTPGNVLLTTNDGRLVETTPKGTVIQSFALPTGAKVSTALANGKVATLCSTMGGPLLSILDPLTGQTTTATYPGWQPPLDAYGFNQLVSLGNYVFVVDATVPQAAGGTASMLLRYDTVNGVWQSFGSANIADPLAAYGSLIAGLDGLLYANVGRNLFFTLPLEVYDPETLQLLRTAPSLVSDLIHFSPGRSPAAAIDATGNTYKLTEFSLYNTALTVTKTGLDGARVAALDPALLGRQDVYPSTNLQVTAEGKIFVPVRDGFVIVSSTLDKVTPYTVFTGRYVSPQISSTLALIRP